MTEDRNLLREILVKHRAVAAQLMEAVTRNRELTAELLVAHGERKQALKRAAEQRRHLVAARAKREEWKRLCFTYERWLGIRKPERNKEAA